MEICKHITNVRPPICSIFGNVNVGKTTFIDLISHKNTREAGNITQDIRCIYLSTNDMTSFFPKDRKVSYENVPGILFVDTPGHDVFHESRRKINEMCDICIIILDITQGIDAGTIKIINMMKQYKVPFIVIANKLDKIFDWKSRRGATLKQALKQSRDVKLMYQQHIDNIKLSFAEQGLNAELYYENKNIKKFISIVPMSSKTGEGSPDLLNFILTISNKFLTEKLSVNNDQKIYILNSEMRKGFGTCLNVILLSGRLSIGDEINFLDVKNNSIKRKIIKILTSDNKQHKQVNIYDNSILLKLVIKDMSNIIVNSGYNDTAKKNKKEQSLRHSVSLIKKSKQGVFVRSSTLDKLQALTLELQNKGIPILEYKLGNISKRDMIHLNGKNTNKNFNLLLGYDVAKVAKPLQVYAKTYNIRIITSPIIYEILNPIIKHFDTLRQQQIELKESKKIYSCRCKILPECIFNKKNPIIIGVKVLSGKLKINSPLRTENMHIGKVVSIKYNNKDIFCAEKGQQVSIKIESQDNMIYGRHFNNVDILYTQRHH